MPSAKRTSVYLAKRTQNHLGKLIDIVYYLLILAGFYLFVKYALWPVFPFLFSLVVAMALQKPMNFALRKFNIKKSFTAVMLVLLFYLLLILIVVLIGARIFTAAKSFTGYLSQQVHNLPDMVRGMQLRISDIAQRLPDNMEIRFNTWLGDFVEKLLSGQNAQGEQVGIWNSLISRIDLEWFKTPMSGVLSAAGQIPSFAIAVVITIVASFFTTLSYDTIVGFLKRQLSEKNRATLSAAKRILFSSLGRLVRSYAILLGVSFGELLLGLWLLKLIGVFDGKYLFGIALAASFCDLLPVLGVGTVLIPWGLYNLIMGNFGLGVGLLIVWVVIVVVRQILEPKLVSAGLGLPPIVTLAGMYIGLQLFGVIGMLIVPLLLILLKLLNDEGVIRLWEKAKPTEPPAEKPANDKAAEKKKTAEKKKAEG